THMPAATSAWTCAGTADANWPSLNMVAFRPFCLSALSKAGVWALDGPSSKVSPTYPALQLAARAGTAPAVTVTAPAMARAVTARPVARVRRDGRGMMLIWVIPPIAGGATAVRHV